MRQRGRERPVVVIAIEHTQRDKRVIMNIAKWRIKANEIEKSFNRTFYHICLQSSHYLHLFKSAG